VEQHISNFYLRSLTAGHTSKCKPCHKRAVDKWRKENPKKYQSYCKVWASRNSEKVKESQDRYWKKHPGKLKEKWARHQIVRRYGATLKLNKSQKWAMQLIYGLCPQGFEVDHIIPLRGKNVSGLHVPYNLQYLTKEENRKKGNRL